MTLSITTPDWPLPEAIIAGTTCRSGGVSAAPYSSLNLGMHVGDKPSNVSSNRSKLEQVFAPSKPPLYLNQVHGSHVLDLDLTITSTQADASTTRQRNTPCVIMTADCLPILLCDASGQRIAAIHAGWRGIYSGIIQKTVDRFEASNGDIFAWLGPAISQKNYEVDDLFRDRFIAQSSNNNGAFSSTRPGHWGANLYQLARNQLQAIGVTHISGGEYCTYEEEERYFSYRREGKTGRMVSFIMIR